MSQTYYTVSNIDIHTTSNVHITDAVVFPKWYHICTECDKRVENNSMDFMPHGFFIRDNDSNSTLCTYLCSNECVQKYSEKIKGLKELSKFAPPT